jgi:hypothetical protein
MGKNIKKYEDFLRLYESGYNSLQTGMNPSTSFGLTDLSTINTGGAVEPKDPNLSFDAWDKHKANMRDEFSRMSDILASVFAQTNVKIGKQFEESIEDLSIVKIYRNNNGALDIYIKFMFMDEIFYGSFKNWGHYNEPTFKSSITQIPELMYQSENIIRLVGLIKETLDKWFKPTEDDYYRALQEVRVYNEMGQIFTLPQGAEVLIEDVVTQDKEPIIYMSYDNRMYTLTGLDYYFFHWWFKSEEKKEFYL